AAPPSPPPATAPPRAPPAASPPPPPPPAPPRPPFGDAPRAPAVNESSEDPLPASAATGSSCRDLPPRPAATSPRAFAASSGDGSSLVPREPLRSERTDEPPSRSSTLSASPQKGWRR